MTSTGREPQLPTQVSAGVGTPADVVPCSPNDVAADGASEPFQRRLAADCESPLPVKAAFQPFASCTPSGQVHVTCQPRSGAVPVDFTVTVAVNPLPQLLSVRQVAVHAVVVVDESGCVVAVTALDAAETLPAASLARTVYV